LEAEAHWGTEAKVPVGPIVEIAGELQFGVWDYFWVNSFFEPEDFPEPSLKRWASIGIGKASSRTGTDAKDMFGEKVDAAVSELERYYRPQMQLKGR
jgi:hypothetical protein